MRVGGFVKYGLGFAGHDMDNRSNFDALERRDRRHLQRPGRQYREDQPYASRTRPSFLGPGDGRR